jgi:hypothetical protein
MIVTVTLSQISVSHASDSTKLESMRQLQAAITEIHTTKSLMPEPLRKNLDSALARLQYVQSVLQDGTSFEGEYFCSVESSFHNRVFNGRGRYELEAKSKALEKCKSEARIFCDEETLQCERSSN